MKFKEIVDLKRHFYPVFNIEEEIENYWEQFIPNDNFYELLETVLKAVSSSNLKDKLSVWLVGRYGTGKSHATAVIKHLLWDNIEDIKDYLDTLKPKYKEQILAFRSKKSFIPIVLKGGGNVTDARTLSLEIEKAVKRSLKENNIEIIAKSDFDRIKDKIDEEYLNWDAIISNNVQLNALISSKDDIKTYLEREDTDVLRIIESVLSENGIHISYKKISEWLKEISNKIKEQNLADGLIIYWDEFTTILEKENISELINEIQSIAELAPKDDVYIYIISHRDYNQFSQKTQEVLDKVRDRFHTIRYPMVPITIYKIVASAIWKKDKEKYAELKDQIFENKELIALINFVSQGTEGNIKESIKELYPLHPYTVYLSTFLANSLGSAQRSIFNFLFDDKYGFKKFIEDNDALPNNFLTADYLWDFYIDTLDKDNENRFIQILEKYSTYKVQIENQNPNFLKVFKGLLLLNTLYRITEFTSQETDKVSPHIENIKKLFIGTPIENDVEEALRYIDSKEIIQKNPNNLFEISQTALPRNEIEQQKQILINQIKDNIRNVLDLKKNILSKIENIFTKRDILRPINIHFFSTTTNTHILKNNLSKYFDVSYKLNFAVFLKLYDEDTLVIESTIKQVIKEEDFNNIIFIVVQESLGESRFKKFIEYMARARVSENHSFQENSEKEENFATKILEQWVEDIYYLDVYFANEDKKTIDKNSLGEHINNFIAPRIYSKGIDNLPLPIKAEPAWKEQSTKKAIEIVINAEKREDLEKAQSQFNSIKNIFKDKNEEYIIEVKNLKLKQEDFEHPVVYIYKFVKQNINTNSKRPNFNLAEILRDLTRPPYGLYTNVLNMALLAYPFREYINKLYIAGEGRLIDKIGMRDLLAALFECWKKQKGCDKLRVRLGSEEEDKLLEVLAKLFDINNYQSLQDLRWKIRNKIKKIGYPIWALKYLTEYNEVKELINKINSFVYDLDDSKIDKDFIIDLLNLLDSSYKDIELLTPFENKLKDGFITFIKEKSDNNILEKDITSIEAYIRKEQPEELNWNEEKVEILVLKWLMDNQVKITDAKITDKENIHITENKKDKEKKISHNPNDELPKIKDTIEKISDVKRLKRIIINLIDERQDLIDIIKRYLEL